MTRVILEIERLNSIKKQLETLIEKSQDVKPDNQKKLVKQKTSFLTEKEKRIFDFVKNNDGTSKQAVVDHFKNNKMYSRVPVFRGIETLVKYRMLMVKVDNKNSQVHHLYINNQNLIASVQEDIALIQQSLCNLMSKSTQIYDELEKRVKRNTNNSESIRRMGNIDLKTTSFIVRYFWHLISTYAWYAIFEWPQQIKDTEVLNRLYLTVFQKMQEVLNDIEKYVPFGVTEKAEKTESKLPKYIQIYLRFQADELKGHFHENGLDVEFDMLMDTLWKIGDKSLLKSRLNNGRAPIK